MIILGLGFMDERRGGTCALHASGVTLYDCGEYHFEFCASCIGKLGPENRGRNTCLPRLEIRRPGDWNTRDIVKGLALNRLYFQQVLDFLNWETCGCMLASSGNEGGTHSRNIPQNKR